MKLILAAAMIGAAAATSTPLHRYLDHARVMVISAPKASDGAVEELGGGLEVRRG
jgi:hypothetical protein